MEVDGLCEIVAVELFGVEVDEMLVGELVGELVDELVVEAAVELEVVTAPITDAIKVPFFSSQHAVLLSLPVEQHQEPSEHCFNGTF